MKIKENIYLLELPNITPGRNDSIYPTLIKKNQDLTLIDTGFPNQVDDIKSAIEKENLDFTHLKTIILTHHDIDHMGNVKAILKLLPHIELIVYEDEADYINGSKTPCKVEMLEKNFHKLNDVNYNQEIYLNSLKKIEDLPIESVICYHGGYFIGSPLDK